MNAMIQAIHETIQIEAGLEPASWAVLADNYEDIEDKETADIIRLSLEMSKASKDENFPLNGVARGMVVWLSGNLNRQSTFATLYQSLPKLHRVVDYRRVDQEVRKVFPDHSELTGNLVWCVYVLNNWRKYQ